MRLVPAWIVLLGACASAAPRATVSTDAGSSRPPRESASNRTTIAQDPGEGPWGEWLVATSTSSGAERERGTALRFSTEGFEMVTAAGQADRRPLVGLRRDGAAWVATSGDLTLRLAPRPDGGWRLSDGERHLQLDACPPDQAAEYSRRAAAVPDPAVVCEQAARCCPVAMALLGGNCDLEFELAERGATTCTNSLKGFRSLMATRGVAVPPECAER